MSGSWAIAFPTDPFWIPSQDRADAAVAVFAILVDGDSSVEVRTSHEWGFESAGGRFGSAACPRCGSVVAQNPEDMTWLLAQLDRIFTQAADSRALQVTMPCCGQTQSMNELIYNPPAGFASWSMSVRQPRFAAEERERALVAAAPGHDVSIIETNG